MPKLTASQWALFVVFQIFFGLVVFAVTRDYYLREGPPRAPEASAPVMSGAVPPGTSVAPAAREFGLAPPAADSNDPQVLVRQGDDLFGQGRYKDAIPLYEKALALSPDDALIYNDLGLALHYTGESQRAVKLLNQGTTKQPDYQRIWLTLGFVQMENGNNEAARTALTKAQSLDPKNSIGQEAARLLGSLKQAPGNG